MCHHDTDRTVTAAADKRITRKKDEMDRKLDERQASAKAKLFSIRCFSLALFFVGSSAEKMFSLFRSIQRYFGNLLTSASAARWANTIGR